MWEIIYLFIHSLTETYKLLNTRRKKPPNERSKPFPESIHRQPKVDKILEIEN